MDTRPTRPTEGLSLHALPKAHPSTWVDEARASLLFDIVLPAMRLPEVAREAAKGPGGGSGGSTGGATPLPFPFPFPSPEAMKVARAFVAHYAQLEFAPRVHLGATVNSPLVLGAAGGLSGWPFDDEDDPLYDHTAHLVGRGIRAAAVQAARVCGEPVPDLLDLATAEPPALTRILDRLHTFLTNAAVHFYHRQGAELHSYLLDKQLVELMIEG